MRKYKSKIRLSKFERIPKKVEKQFAKNLKRALFDSSGFDHWPGGTNLEPLFLVKTRVGALFDFYKHGVFQDAKTMASVKQ